MSSSVVCLAVLPITAVFIDPTEGISVQDELHSAEEKLQALEDEAQQLQAEKASQEERARMAERKLEELRSNCQAHLYSDRPFILCLCSSCKSAMQAWTSL